MSKRAGGSVREAARRQAQPPKPPKERSRVTAWRAIHPGEPLSDEMVAWVAAMDANEARARDPLAQLQANRSNLEKAEAWVASLLVERAAWLEKARAADATWPAIEAAAGVSRPGLLSSAGRVARSDVRA